jgi:hypothetical protein
VGATTTTARSSRGRRREAPADAPLRSLLHPEGRPQDRCRSCGSDRLTRIGLELGDGTQVRFTSCRDCETRAWEAGDRVLSVDSVLERARPAQ